MRPGQRHSPEAISKLRGLKRSPETRARVSAARQGRPMSLEQRAQISAKLSFPWDEKSVASKHAWVAKNFVDPGTCETCGAGGRLHWASIGHTYTQIRSDWRRLCSRCHQRLDRGSDVALFVRGAIW